MRGVLNSSRLDQGALIAFIEVPTRLTTSHDTARHGRHRADNNYLARGKDSETQIKPFYEFERRKELDGGTEGRGVLL